MRETSERKKKRIEREMKRTGRLRFLDVVAFRAFYQFFLAAKDKAWEQQRAEELCEKYSKSRAPELITATPNTAEAEAFVKEVR